MRQTWPKDPAEDRMGLKLVSDDREALSELSTDLDGLQQPLQPGFATLSCGTSETDKSVGSFGRRTGTYDPHCASSSCSCLTLAFRASVRMPDNVTE